MTATAYLYTPESGLATIDDTRVDSLPDPKDLGEQATLWIDIQTDNAEELLELGKRYHLHELALEDALTPGHHPKLEDHGSYIFMIFRALKPLYGIDGDELEEEEIEEEEHTSGLAIFLAPRFIITHRMKDMGWMDALVRQVKALPDPLMKGGPYDVAHRIIDVLVDRFQRGVSFFDDLIDTLEEQIVEEPEDFEIAKILGSKRELQTLRHIVRDQRVVVMRMLNEIPSIREGRLRRYFKDIDDHLLAIMSTIDKQIDNFHGLRDVYFAMANVRLGDIMRILAVFTTIAVPLNLVVGLYGMNFDMIPLLHNPKGFWMIMGAMLMVAMVMLLFFRRNRWI